LCVLYCMFITWTSFALQDVQWSDIDYMKLHLDWTYDADGAYADLPAIVKDLHDHNQKYVIIVVSPFVSLFFESAAPCWRRGCKIRITKFLVRMS